MEESKSPGKGDEPANGPACINLNADGGYDYEHTDNGTGACTLCTCPSFVPNL